MPFDWNAGGTPDKPLNISGSAKIPDPEDQDVMEDGFDSDSEEIPSQPITTNANAIVDEIMAKPQQPQPVQPQEEQTISELEYRLEKAQYYKLLINSQLLESESTAAIEVENEIQDFVKEQLAILMGIKQAVQPFSAKVNEWNILIQEKIAKSLPFSNEEVDALKAVAARILKKPEIVAPVVKPVTVAPSIDIGPFKPPMAGEIKAVAAPQASESGVKRVFGEIRRGRGRPRKSACMTCGQMVCVCAKGKPVAAETVQPMPQGQISVLPDGTQIVEAQGRRYRLVKKNVMYRDGTMREEVVPQDITPPPPRPPDAKPYPSEQEAMMQAQNEAAQQLSRAPAILGTLMGLAQATTGVSQAEPQEREFDVNDHP